MATALTAPAATIVDNRTGTAESIDAAAFKALKGFLHALGAAYVDVDADENDIRLTTGQAGEIVGASSRTIARLIDQGRIKGTRVGGGHRYVMLSDLMEFDRRIKAERPKHLERMRQIADEEGMYDDDYNAAVTEYLKSFL